MGYSLHIELPNDEELDLEEWLEAVSETDGARPAGAGGHQAVNPATGETIAIAGSEGDVEVYDPDEDAWHPVLHWNDRRGRASMNSRALPIVGGELVGPVGEVVKALAMRLGAQIRGDEGEIYPL
jgi:sugar (pentulose or hexulose) kinase